MKYLVIYMIMSSVVTLFQCDRLQEHHIQEQVIPARCVRLGLAIILKSLLKVFHHLGCTTPTSSSDLGNTISFFAISPKPC